MTNENSKDKDMKNTPKKITVKKTVKDKKVEVVKFEDLEGKFLFVKVGDKDRPATDEDLKDVEDKLVALFNKNNINCLAFVTHHAVSMELIEKENKEA